VCAPFVLEAVAIVRASQAWLIGRMGAVVRVSRKVEK
jgi:hypothetical protein